MRIPASRLAPALTPGLAIEVRRPDYSGFNSAMPYTEAVAMAIRGEVEGIAASSGRVKYLRILRPEEREPVTPPPSPERQSASRSTVIANTRMGVYRQEVESSVMNEWGMPTRIVIGHIWQHYGVSL